MRIYFNEANGLLNIGDHTSILGLGIHVSSRDGNVWVYSAGISDAEFSAPYTQIKDINGDGFASEQECIDYILAQGAMATEKFKGEKGDTGAQGGNGDQGAQGIQGEQGLKGDKGDIGEQGAQGERGLQGAKGDKGDQGLDGAKGADGLQGEQGLQGLAGAKGDKGETGIQGAKGDTGAVGAKGETGLVGYNASGLIATPLKVWLGTVTTDGSGQLDINYSSAGFTAPPKVSVEAHSIDTATEQDRAWATLRGSPTASGAKVYTIRGNIIVSILLGGGVTVRAAPNTKVDVMAIGI